jgi:hypothetical protein
MLVYGLQGRPPLRSAFRIFESEAIEVLDGWGWVKPRRGFTCATGRCIPLRTAAIETQLAYNTAS